MPTWLQFTEYFLWQQAYLKHKSKPRKNTVDTDFRQDCRSLESVSCISVWPHTALQRECKASGSGSGALLDLKAKAILQ